MWGMPPRRVAIALFGLVVGVLLLGGAAAHELLSQRRHADEGDRLDDRFDRSSLATTYGKYDRVAICVQVVDGSVDDGRYARDQLRAAATAFIGPRPGPTVRSSLKFPPLIDLSCPSGPARFAGPRWYRWLMQPGRVAERQGDPFPRPSPYWLHLYLVDPVRQEPSERDPYWPRYSAKIEEYATDNPYGHVSTGRTSGKYVARDQVASLTAVEELLEWQFGLERRMRPPTATSSPHRYLPASVVMTPTPPPTPSPP
jgi:hypothetical protein